MAVAIAMRTWRRRAGDSAERLRRAEAEHEAETRRAVEAERARIASELHDVVTHNVSVMVVQAGAARRVLGSSPGQAPEADRVQTAVEALLAVEASGRTAMGELRHLLGLLAPSGEAPGGDDAVLVPQPDLGQVRSLVERVRAAGLPVELVITGARALPPGRGPGRLPRGPGSADQRDQAREPGPFGRPYRIRRARTADRRGGRRPPAV